MASKEGAELEASLLATGNTLQREALALDEEIERRMGETQRAAESNDAAGAVKHFKQWKGNVGRLHDQIEHQLKHCRALRANQTLLSLYEDTESEVRRKEVNNCTSLLMGDIRSMLKNYPEARAITLPSLEQEELELLNEQNAAEAAMAEARAEEQYAHKHQGSSAGKTSPSDEDDRDGPPNPTSRAPTTNSTFAVNKLLQSITLPKEGERHLGVFSHSTYDGAIPVDCIGRRAGPPESANFMSLLEWSWILMHSNRARLVKGARCTC